MTKQRKTWIFGTLLVLLVVLSQVAFAYEIALETQVESKEYVQIGPSLTILKTPTPALKTEKGFSYASGLTAPQAMPATEAFDTVLESTSKTMAATQTAGENFAQLFVLNKKLEEKPSLGQTASVVNKAKSIDSFFFDPKEKKMLAQVENESGGRSIQEIPNELFPKIVKDGLEIANDTGEKKVVLSQGGASAKTGNGLTVSSEGIFIDTQNTREKIEVLPQQAKQIAKQKTGLKEISFEIKTEKENASYVFSGKKTGKLFGILPTEYEITAEIDAKTGAAKVEQPFWAVFIFG